MKNIVIIISIIAILALGAGVFLAWQKYSQPVNTLSLISTSSVAQSSVNYNFSSSTQPRLKRINKEPAWFYWLSSGGILSASSGAPVSRIDSSASLSPALFYISANDHKIREISGEGETIISDSLAQDYQFAATSADGNLIALKTGDRSAGQWKIFDARKKIQLASLSSVSAFSWSPSDNKSAYFQENNKGAVDLIINDFTAAKQKPQKIISFNQKDFSLQWVSNNDILLSSPFSFDWESEVWRLDIKGKTLKKIATGKSLVINWMKKGQEGVKWEQLGGESYKLNLVNFSGEEQASFKFKTFPDKCSIATAFQLYCAISKNQEIFSLIDIFDKYMKREIYFKDGIYKVDLAENKFTPLYEGENPVIDAVNIVFDGGRLYFINRYDKGLYRLDL